MAPMAESMPACTVDSTGYIVAVRRAWRDVGQLFERALVVFANGDGALSYWVVNAVILAFGIGLNRLGHRLRVSREKFRVSL